MRQFDEVTIGPCRLICGDCKDVLPTLGQVDAVVTDPPYGLDFLYASYCDTPETHQMKCAEWLSLMRRCAPTIFVFTSIGSLFLWERPDWIIAWHKVFSVTHSPFGSNNWEPVAVYGNPKRKERCSDFFAATFMHLGAIGHPCPKPTHAMKGLLQIASVQGEVILDPFMGSGTTGIACLQLGRAFIGVEIDPTYFALACRRVEAAYAQLDLTLPQTWQPPQQLSLTGGTS